MAKLSKFEIELPAAPKSSKLSLSERDIAMATMYVSHFFGKVGQFENAGRGEGHYNGCTCFSSAVALKHFSYCLEQSI